MTKQISIKQFSPELQRAINKEVSSLKNSKWVLSKTELSEEYNDDDEVYGQLEDALYDLIDDTAKFYTLDEDEAIRRNTAKIKEYIKSKLFSKVTSIKGLEVFLANSKFAIRSALDRAASSESISMVDDENYTDFLEDIKEAARKRITELKS